ncbi:MAG TPA: class I SAM-dependent methyltransferase [Ktedonobacterales bacterium]|nr:class I SAM-dependent methyltransferase [Ktedonobacterales bacterium]
MARWTRAIAALPFHDGAVLDLGCAFGFTTRLLKRRGYDATGVDSSEAYIERAIRADPSGTYLVGDAAHVPLPDGSFDGVLFLDVLEHLPDAQGAIREVARVLRPGGTLALSVPYRGPLAWLDSLNLYARFVKRTGHGRFPPEIAATGHHRHFSVNEARALLGDDFSVRAVRRTGLGIAELVHLPMLFAFRWVAPLEWVYQRAAFVYYTAYLAEDMLPLGPLGYHLMVVATRRPSGEQSQPEQLVQE